jgi:hypothetical protein
MAPTILTRALTTLEAEMMGADARREGAPLTDNPFDALRQSWEEGWRDEDDALRLTSQ